MKNVLVTGSEGIIGRSIVAAIANRWPDVKVTRTSSRHGRPVVMVDLCDRVETLELFDSVSPDVVIHAAASPYGMGHPPFNVAANDIRMTANLLQAAIGVTKHIVFLSSATVYENATGPLAETAADGARPTSPIGFSKAACEQLVRAWAEQCRASATIWRLFNVVSPAEPHDRPGHVIVDLYRKLFVERVPKLVITRPRAQRCYTWIDDVATGIVSYLDDDRTRNQVFNLGSNEARTVAELADALLTTGYHYKILPANYRPLISYDDADLNSPSVSAPHIRKAATRLGWSPTTSFSECIEKFVKGKQLHA